MSDTRLKPRDPARAAVVFIEFQREWLDADGKIHRLIQDLAQYDAAVEGGRRLLALAREHGMHVVHSGLRFQTGHPELGKDGLGLRGAIPRAGTFLIDGKGSQFAPGFEPRPGEFVPQGRTGASAFAGSNLDAYFRASRINEILICGFALHVCVESTLRHGHDLGYNVWVVEDATSAFTKAQRDYVFQDVVHHYGELISVLELQALLVDKAAA